MAKRNYKPEEIVSKLMKPQPKPEARPESKSESKRYFAPHSDLKPVCAS